MAKLMFNCTHGREDAERATLPFILGNVAVTADQEAIVLLTAEGVWPATRSYADDIHKEGMQPLAELLRSYVENGGIIWACGACTKPRGISETDLVKGAKIVTAANVAEYLVQGASALSF